MFKSKERKDRTIAAFLAILGGGFGIHRFYLGQTQKGLFYLLFSLTGITTIISIFDCVSFLSMPQEKFDAIYNDQVYIQQDYKATQTHNVADEIYKLDILFRKGVITFEEFERRKARLLNV